MDTQLNPNARKGQPYTKGQAPPILRAEFEAIADSLGLTIPDGDHRRGPDPFTGEGKDGFCFFFPECNGSNRSGDFTKSRREMLERAGVQSTPRRAQIVTLPKAPSGKTFDTRSLEERGLTKEARARFGISEPRGVRESWGEYRQFPTHHPDGSEGRERRKFRDPSKQPTTNKDGQPRRQVKTLWDKASEGSGQPIAYNLNAIEEGDRVYLVNSELAVWNFWQEGLTAISPLGEGRSEASYRAMLEAAKGKGAASLTIALDADATGESATARASSAARAVGLKAMAKVWPVGVGDASDFWEKCRDEGRDFGPALDELPTRPDAPTDEAEQPAPRPRFVIDDAQTVKAFKTPAALVQGILYENTAAEVAGAAASYKTGIVLGMSYAVAGGHKWNERATKKTPVVYISGEGRGGLAKRIRALEAWHQAPCKVQFLTESVQIHRPEEVEALLLAMAQLPEMPGLIIVDTLARCFVGGDENSARDAGLFNAGVDRIRAVTGATVLILHHLNKIGDARGSTAFGGAFDTVIEAKRENTTVTLRCLKQKDAEEFEPMSFARRVIEFEERDEYGHNITSLVFEATDAVRAELPKADQTRQEIAQILEGVSEGLTASKWQKEAEERLGIKKTQFYFHRDALTKTGEVTEQNRIYKVTPVTPVTPVLPQPERKSYSGYSGVSLDTGEPEQIAGVNGRSSIFDDEEAPKPNGYGQD